MVISQEAKLKALHKQNFRCFNCDQIGSSYIVPGIWIFVCSDCSGKHMGNGQRVKSVTMGKFTAEEVATLEAAGNKKAELTYLAKWDGHGDTERPTDRNPRKVDAWIKTVFLDKYYYSELPVKSIDTTAIPVRKVSEVLGEEIKIQVSPKGSDADQLTFLPSFAAASANVSPPASMALSPPARPGRSIPTPSPAADPFDPFSASSFQTPAVVRVPPPSSSNGGVGSPFAAFPGPPRAQAGLNGTAPSSQAISSPQVPVQAAAASLSAPGTHNSNFKFQNSSDFGFDGFQQLSVAHANTSATMAQAQMPAPAPTPRPAAAATPASTSTTSTDLFSCSTSVPLAAPASNFSALAAHRAPTDMTNAASSDWTDFTDAPTTTAAVTGGSPPPHPLQNLLFASAAEQSFPAFPSPAAAAPTTTSTQLSAASSSMDSFSSFAGAPLAFERGASQAGPSRLSSQSAEWAAFGDDSTFTSDARPGITNHAAPTASLSTHPGAANPGAANPGAPNPLAPSAYSARASAPAAAPTPATAQASTPLVVSSTSAPGTAAPAAYKTRGALPADLFSDPSPPPPQPAAHRPQHVPRPSENFQAQPVKQVSAQLLYSESRGQREAQVQPHQMEQNLHVQNPTQQQAQMQPQQQQPQSSPWQQQQPMQPQEQQVQQQRLQKMQQQQQQMQQQQQQQQMQQMQPQQQQMQQQQQQKMQQQQQMQMQPQQQQMQQQQHQQMQQQQWPSQPGNLQPTAQPHPPVYNLNADASSAGHMRQQTNTSSYQRPSSVATSNFGAPTNSSFGQSQMPAQQQHVQPPLQHQHQQQHFQQMQHQHQQQPQKQQMQKQHEQQHFQQTQHQHQQQPQKQQMQQQHQQQHFQQQHQQYQQQQHLKFHEEEHSALDVNPFEDFSGLHSALPKGPALKSTYQPSQSDRTAEVEAPNPFLNPFL